MVFKVDFEKAFDSVRRGYLNDNLKSLGFGDKCCNWINDRLKSATGSVLVIFSPTSEFHFHKGLKQRDPLFPFLFILIMEILHLSFIRVQNTGLFKGISINESGDISNFLRR